MSKITWSETELEKETGTFLNAACSLPGRIISVNNGMASAGNIEVSIQSELFQKLIKVGWVAPYKSAYKVTALGVAFADK